MESFERQIELVGGDFIRISWRAGRGGALVYDNATDCVAHLHLREEDVEQMISSLERVRAAMWAESPEGMIQAS